MIVDCINELMGWPPNVKSDLFTHLLGFWYILRTLIHAKTYEKHINSNEVIIKNRKGPLLLFLVSNDELNKQ